MKKAKVKIMNLNTPNNNGRIYNTEVMKEALENYLKKEDKFGMVEPNYVNENIQLGEISHKVEDLRIEENELVGDITILDTNKGQLVQTLLENNIKLAVAPRMTYNEVEMKDENGNVILDENGNPKTEIKDVNLISIDIIQNSNKVFENAELKVEE